MPDVRTHCGVNSDLGDYLVITRITAKISRSKYIMNKETAIGFNISNSKQTEVRKEYEQKIELCQTSGVEWINLKTILKTVK
jgi:hypothetical protein